MPVTEDEDGNTSVGNLCSDGVGDPYLNYNVTDDGETQEISATVYQVSGKSEHTQYVNPRMILHLRPDRRRMILFRTARVFPTGKMPGED